MDEANRFLLQRMAKVGVHLHPTFQTEPFQKMKQEIELLLPPLDPATTTDTTTSNNIATNSAPMLRSDSSRRKLMS